MVAKKGPVMSLYCLSIGKKENKRDQTDPENVLFCSKKKRHMQMRQNIRKAGR
mgnify:CR=1 FL=1